MKKILIVLSLAVFVFACSRKTIPTAVENKAPKNTEQASFSADSTAVVKGKLVYINRCGRCHNLKPVQKYTAEEWHPILQTMIHKARLNTIDSATVAAYVLAGAKSN